MAAAGAASHFMPQIAKMTSPFMRAAGGRLAKPVFRAAKGLGSMFGGAAKSVERTGAAKSLGMSVADPRFEHAAPGMAESLFNWGQKGQIQAKGVVGRASQEMLGAEGANGLAGKAKNIASMIPSGTALLGSQYYNPLWGGGYGESVLDRSQSEARGAAQVLDKAHNAPLMQRLGYMFNPDSIFSEMNPAMMEQIAPYLSKETLNAVRQKMTGGQ